MVASGQVGAVAGSLVDGGVAAQTRQALANLAELLASEGSSLADVVKTTVFLRHIADFGQMNDAYAQVFAEHRPARSTVAIAGLPLDALVEVEAWAYAGGSAG